MMRQRTAPVDVARQSISDNELLMPTQLRKQTRGDRLRYFARWGSLTTSYASKYAVAAAAVQRPELT